MDSKDKVIELEDKSWPKDEVLKYCAMEIQGLISRKEQDIRSEKWKLYLADDEDSNQKCIEELTILLADSEYADKKVVGYSQHDGYGSTSIGIVHLEEKFLDENGVESTRVVKYFMKNISLFNSSNLLSSMLDYNSRDDTSYCNEFFDSINEVLNSYPCNNYGKEFKYSIIQHAASDHTMDELSAFIFYNSRKTRVKTPALTLHFDPEKSRYFILSRDIFENTKKDKETVRVIFCTESEKEYDQYGVDKESEIMMSMYCIMYGISDLVTAGNVGAVYTTKKGAPTKGSAMVIDTLINSEVTERTLEDLPGWGQWLIGYKNYELDIHNLFHSDTEKVALIPNIFLLPRNSGLVTGTKTELKEGTDEFKELHSQELFFYETLTSHKLFHRYDPDNPLSNEESYMNFALYLYMPIIELKKKFDNIHAKYPESGVVDWNDIVEHINLAKNAMLLNTIHILNELYNGLELSTISNDNKEKFGRKLQLAISDINKELVGLSESAETDWEKLEKTFFPGPNVKAQVKVSSSTKDKTPPLYNADDYIKNSWEYTDVEDIDEFINEDIDEFIDENIDESINEDIDESINEDIIESTDKNISFDERVRFGDITSVLNDTTSHEKVKSKPHEDEIVAPITKEKITNTFNYYKDLIPKNDVFIIKTLNKIATEKPAQSKIDVEQSPASKEVNSKRKKVYKEKLPHKEQGGVLGKIFIKGTKALGNVPNENKEINENADIPPYKYDNSTELRLSRAVPVINMETTEKDEKSINYAPKLNKQLVSRLYELPPIKESKYPMKYIPKERNHQASVPPLLTGVSKYFHEKKDSTINSKEHKKNQGYKVSFNKNPLVSNRLGFKSSVLKTAPSKVISNMKLLNPINENNNIKIDIKPTQHTNSSVPPLLIESKWLHRKKDPTIKSQEPKKEQAYKMSVSENPLVSNMKLLNPINENNNIKIDIKPTQHTNSCVPPLFNSVNKQFHQHNDINKKNVIKNEKDFNITGFNSMKVKKENNLFPERNLVDNRDVKDNNKSKDMIV